MEVIEGPLREQLLATNPYIERLKLPLQHASIHYYERGEYIVEEGVAPSAFYFIIKGRCKIYLTHENGKASLLNFISEGAFIGEIELLNETHVAKGVQTATDVYCIVFPFTYYREYCLQNTTFLRELSMYLGNKAIEMGYKVSIQQAYPLENRLAFFMLLAAQHNVYQERHTEACDYLGVSYRHLLHTFSIFCEKGYLTKDGRTYILKNIDALNELAQALSIQKSTAANR